MFNCVPVTVLSALNILSYLILTVPQQGYYFYFTLKGLSLMMILQLAQGYTASKQLDFENRGLDTITDSGINGENPFPAIESHCF